MSDTRTARYERDQRSEGRDRGRGRGRGSMLNYYDDMGMSSTEQGHEKFVEYKTRQDKAMAAEKKRLSQLQSQVNKERSKYNSQQAQLNQYKSQIDERKSAIAQASKQASGSNLKGLVNDAWRQTKQSRLVPVSVVTGKNNQIEGTYYVTKDQAKQMASQFDHYNVDKNGKWYIHAAVQGRVRGQELHDGLRMAQQNIETQVKQQAQREIALAMKDAQGQISAAKSALGQAQSQYNDGKGNLVKWKGNLDRAKMSVSLQKEQLAKFGEQEQKFLADLGSQYDKKIDAMRRIAMGTSVEEGATETEGGILSQLEGQGPTLTEQVVAGENIPVAKAGPEEEVNNG